MADIWGNLFRYNNLDIALIYHSAKCDVLFNKFCLRAKTYFYFYKDKGATEF